MLSSEAGTLDVDPAKILVAGSLGPGQMLIVDPREGRVIFDDEIKDDLANQAPYLDSVSYTHLEHPTEHFGRAAEHRREHACDPFDALTDELAGGHLRHVSEHPATHNGVEHHQDHAADIRPPAEPVPFA